MHYEFKYSRSVNRVAFQLFIFAWLVRGERAFLKEKK